MVNDPDNKAVFEDIKAVVEASKAPVKVIIETCLLTDEEKEIVLLRIVDDMKHKDIAKIVDKPLGTVTWLYQQALDKMKKVRG